jgi:hypothetical protein
MTAYAVFAIQTADVVSGWLSRVLPMYFLGGVQLFCFGIIGEYIGKNLFRSKTKTTLFY